MKGHEELHLIGISGAGSARAEWPPCWSSFGVGNARRTRRSHEGQRGDERGRLGCGPGLAAVPTANAEHAEDAENAERSTARRSDQRLSTTDHQPSTTSQRPLLVVANDHRLATSDHQPSTSRRPSAPTAFLTSNDGRLSTRISPPRLPISAVAVSAKSAPSVSSAPRIVDASPPRGTRTADAPSAQLANDRPPH